MKRLLLVVCGALADHVGFTTRGAEGRRLCGGGGGGGGGALIDFSTRVELCEKLSAALNSDGGATTAETLCARDVICDVPEIRRGS